MDILLTNDDGIFAPGILAIYKKLQKLGKVCVVAPDGERSSASHAISLTRPLEVTKAERSGKFFGYALSGTPTDCVKFAANQILRRVPDLVVSGINAGPNDGYSVFYSGTVGAAREGALMGAQAVALSIATFKDTHFDDAADLGMRVIRRLIKQPLPRGSFLNVNIPNRSKAEIKGIRVTRQGEHAFLEDYVKREKPHGREYFWLSTRPMPKATDLAVDTAALQNGYVTVTPLQSNLTDFDALKVFEQMKW